MITISACVVVKNEEKNILQWLKNTAEFANEQIVVDTGSEDRTVDLAASFGATINHFRWEDDFASAKNFALGQAKGDWIVFLDADEYFSDKSLGALYGEIEKYHMKQNVDGLVCPLINIDLDENNRLINKTVQMRVFRNKSYLRYEGKIHEHVVNHIQKTLKTCFVDLEIIHTGYTKSIVQKKLRRNLNLLEADIAENGEQAEHYAYLVSSYFGLGEYDRAIEYARTAIQKEMPLLGQEYSIYRGWIDACFLGKRNKSEILSVVEEAIRKFPDIPEFVWNKGEILYLQQDFIAAEKYFLKALKISQVANPDVVDLRSSVFEAQLFFLYYRLGSIYVLKGDIISAIAYFKASLQCFSCNETVFESLYRLLRKEDPVEQIVFFNELYNDNEYEQEFLLKMLRKNRAGKVYAYFAQRLHKRNEIDLYMSVEKNEEAFSLLEDELEKEYAKLLLGEQIFNEKRELLSVMLPLKYQDVLAGIYGEKDISEEAQVFCEVIKDSQRNKI